MSAWTSPPPAAGRSARNAARPEREGPAARSMPAAARQPESSPPSGEHHLPAGAHVGDRRGLTATGAVTLALVLGVAGAVIDVSSGRGLRTVFAICFVLGCALAALLVHREDLKVAVVMPPLIYCVLALIAGALGKTPVAGSLLKSQGLELVSALVLGAPVLFAATAAALLVALVRLVRGRSRTA